MITMGMAGESRPLDAFERWMVASNLATVRESGVTVAEQAAVLRANGYERVARAVETAETEVQ